ncbi:uncharacterized protein LOC143433456 [Xylocopa sonorina]|uniref:uncharacterized protein LOC143433456 n=1 Tax=Xylocopa sonorina TaxID=1818115 RepID=UPI00403AD9A8
MNPKKWYLILIVMIALVSTGNQSPSKGSSEKSTSREANQPQKRRASKPDQSFNAPSYWVHILREFVFKTISPPPAGNNQLYKRLLEAPFYGGPYPIVPNDAASIVLSRGEVYQLPTGHWLFCQQGCSDCEPCIEHAHPTIEWVLRRINRVSSHGSTRHDLQLTLMPQIDGGYHMRSLWPQSYVYVTSQGEQDRYLNDVHSYRNDGSAYVVVEDGFAGRQRKNGNFWKYADRTSLPDRNALEKPRNDTVSEERVSNSTEKNVESTTVTPNNKTTDVEEQRTEENVKIQHPQVVSTDTKNGSTDVRSRDNGSGRVKQLTPKLILGTDQLGQKHLVHVIPADASTNTSLMNSVISNVLSSAGQNKTAYQRILRRIFDSLNSNRRSIESFLESSTSTEKMSQPSEVHQQQETRGGFPDIRQIGRLYPLYSKGIRNGSLSLERWPHILNWSKQGRLSSNDPHSDRFVNSTASFGRKSNGSYIVHPKVLNNIIKNKNVSDKFHSKLRENNYSNHNTSDDNFKVNNVSRKSQEYSNSRKYKILVTTESTTRSSKAMNNKNGAQDYS